MKSLIFTFIVLCLLQAVPGFAAGTSPAFPKTFQRTGKLGQIIPRPGHIIISDQVYRLSATTQIITSWSQHARPSALRTGRRVGFEVTGEGGGQHGTITRLWLLPKGARSAR